MKRVYLFSATFVGMIIVFISCSKNDSVPEGAYAAIKATFGNSIDPENLLNYDQQAIPSYVTKDNTGPNVIINAKATLGRVLFYDKKLSFNNTISCGSCHKQAFAFGDTAVLSSGVENGVTMRHSMRLINTRFADERRFFWNERAESLEAQTTQPIRDHAEMGFSGQIGRPDFSAVLSRLRETDYYQELFSFVYGDMNVSEARIQECLSQFIRSIQSFDSKYDAGRAQVNGENAAFPNFSTLENTGKNLFLTRPVFDASGNRSGGGLGCNSCHRAPEFDIDPGSKNNGIIGIANNTGIDITNTRSPSLRDLTNVSQGGRVNTPMMHTGVFRTLQQVVGHYGNINLAPGNTNLDPKLAPNGVGQRLNLTGPEVNALIAFLQTLGGTSVYTDTKWSDPFK